MFNFFWSVPTNFELFKKLATWFFSRGLLRSQVAGASKNVSCIRDKRFFPLSHVLLRLFCFLSKSGPYKAKSSAPMHRATPGWKHMWRNTVQPIMRNAATNCPQTSPGGVAWGRFDRRRSRASSPGGHRTCGHWNFLQRRWRTRLMSSSGWTSQPLRGLKVVRYELCCRTSGGRLSWDTELTECADLSTNLWSEIGRSEQLLGMLNCT